MKWATQRLASYDLVEHAQLRPCYVCDAGNGSDSMFCRHCSAPLTLAYQAESAKRRPALVAVIGAPSSGKTVYLGMLTDILSRQQGPLQILARGAFSVNLQQQAVSALARRRFPASTPPNPEGWNWVHCELSGLAKRRTVELVLPDVSGAAFMSEIEQTDSYPVIRSFLAKCSGAIVLVDTNKLAAGDQEPDFLTMKALSYLLELDGERKRGWPNRPLAIVFSKADCSDACFQNPTSYAETCAPGLWRLCQERFRQCRYFAASVAGACAQVRSRYETFTLPLRVEPRGVTEPLAWLVNQLAK